MPPILPWYKPPHDLMPDSRAHSKPFHAGASSQAVPHRTPPSGWLLALEIRAFWELGTLLPAWPLLRKAPRGDGHSVMVFPGLSANDASTLPLRRYLKSLGYQTWGWEQGLNRGPRDGVLQNTRNHLQRTFDRTGQKVSLIGWSLGGIYARELAKEMPGLVRGVITLGTPFAGTYQATNAWKLYELASGHKVAREADNYDLPCAPPVPTSSIYSRSDGIVAWQASVQRPELQQPQTENIEVLASHIGLGVNPSTWWAVADRLAQAEGQWRPFLHSGLADKGRLHGLIYPDPDRRP